MNDTAITILLSIFGGGGLVTLLQFFINRHDKKHDKYSDVVSEIRGIRTELDEIKADFNHGLSRLQRELEDDRATNARIRIIQFSDEIQHNVKHSKESFDQAHSDIDMYTAHCRKYADYENSKAEAAIANIQKQYQRILDKETDFLN